MNQSTTNCAGRESFFVFISPYCVSFSGCNNPRTTRASIHNGARCTTRWSQDHPGLFSSFAYRERFPTIIEITPYGRDLSAPNFRNEAAYWIKHGYAFVIADTRGTGESEGDFVFIAKEGVDAYDLIEWIARQSWSNERVTMRGASYSGVNQWAAALQQPPHLSCNQSECHTGASNERCAVR